MQAGHNRAHHASDHDVVEVGDDEVRLVTWIFIPRDPERSPSSPPIVKTPMKPGHKASEYSRSSPCTCVEDQLKTLIADGTATSMLMSENTMRGIVGCPTTNM